MVIIVFEPLVATGTNNDHLQVGFGLWIALTKGLQHLHLPKIRFQNSMQLRSQMRFIDHKGTARSEDLWHKMSLFAVVLF